MFIVLILSDSFAQDEISISTSLIANRNFITANDWKNIPITRREDLNAYPCWEASGVYCRPFVSGKGIREERKTVANQQMKIWLDISTESDQTFELLSCSLKTVAVYDLNALEIETGRWSGPRLNPCSFDFEVCEAEILLVDTCKDPVTIKKNNTEDQRFGLNVSICENSPIHQKLFEFSIHLEFKNDRKKIVKAVDRNYFLAAF